MTGRVRGPNERYPGLAEVCCDFPGCISTVDEGLEGEDNIADARAWSRKDYEWTGENGQDFCEKHPVTP